MIKAVFFDVDGTLISHKTSSIPTSALKALQMLKEKGILIFLATGRHKLELDDLPVGNIEFDGYVTLNGQYCYNGEGVIHSMPVPKSNLENVVREMEINPFPCEFVEADRIYINYVDEIVEKAQDAINTPIPEIGSLKEGVNHEVLLVLPFGMENRQDKLKELLPDCKMTRWHEHAFDIINAAGGKEKGIEKVLEYYNIDRKDVMAFGDGDNDVSMFKYAGLSVCLANGSKLALEAADYVSSDIDADGIYNALKHFNII